MKKITKKIILFTCIFMGTLYTNAQINSPYSRFGLGDVLNTKNIINNSLGGSAVAYPSFISNNIGQILNFSNPATYGFLKVTSVDLGVSLESFNINSINPTNTFNSAYFVPRYFAMGMPINKQKEIGLAFGFKQISRVNYNINTSSYLTNDTINNNFEGSGGLYQFFIGIGKNYKNLSVGLNTGVNFGNKRISTNKTLYGTSPSYQNSTTADNQNFSGIFFNPGLQYNILLNSKVDKIRSQTEKLHLLLGLSYEFQQNLSTTQNIKASTITQNSLGDINDLDTVIQKINLGTITLPSTLHIGFSLNKGLFHPSGYFKLWSLGIEYTSTEWSKYKDLDNNVSPLLNSNQLSVGLEFSPNPISDLNRSRLITYRTGFYVGNDFIQDNNTDKKGLSKFGVSIGIGVPIKKYRNYDNQYSMLNYNFIYGQRGTVNNTITEDFVQFSVGITLNDIWFIKRRYD
ncbi:MAG: hypothetical protein ORN58_08305 [Sediminibacterium sp.]|nr:hypothetical protein [Sediminibacterium sp.]